MSQFLVSNNIFVISYWKFAYKNINRPFYFYIMNMCRNGDLINWLELSEQKNCLKWPVIKVIYCLKRLLLSWIINITL